MSDLDDLIDHLPPRTRYACPYCGEPMTPMHHKYRANDRWMYVSVRFVCARPDHRFEVLAKDVGEWHRHVDKLDLARS